eukprot:5779683-Alexandrium_andersonii.AAC.1
MASVVAITSSPSSPAGDSVASPAIGSSVAFPHRRLRGPPRDRLVRRLWACGHLDLRNRRPPAQFVH